MRDDARVPDFVKVKAYRRRVKGFASETLQAQRRADGRYLLEISPQYVMNVAEGDVFEVSAEGWAVPHERGGNVTVQVFHRLDFAPMEQLRQRVAGLGGWVYERTSELAVFTIPVSAGFRRIEAPFERIERLYGDRMTWRFGNVFADDGETTLDWWETDAAEDGPTPA